MKFRGSHLRLLRPIYIFIPVIRFQPSSRISSPAASASPSGSEVNLNGATVDSIKVLYEQYTFTFFDYFGTSWYLYSVLTISDPNNGGMMCIRHELSQLLVFLLVLLFFVQN